MANWQQLNNLTGSPTADSKPLPAPTNQDNQVINNTFDFAEQTVKCLPALENVQPVIEEVKGETVESSIVDEAKTEPQGILKLGKWLVIVFVLVNLIIVGAIIVNAPSLGLSGSNSKTLNPASANPNTSSDSLSVSDFLLQARSAVSDKYYQVTSQGRILLTDTSIIAEGMYLNFGKTGLYSIQTIDSNLTETTGIGLKLNERVIFTSPGTTVIVNDKTKKYTEVPEALALFKTPLSSILALDPTGQIGAVNGDGSVSIIIPTSELLPEAFIQTGTPKTVTLRIWLDANDLIYKIQALSPVNSDLGTMTFQYKELLAKDPAYSGYEDYQKVDYQQWIQ